MAKEWFSVAALALATSCGVAGSEQSAGTALELAGDRCSEVGGVRWSGDALGDTTCPRGLEALGSLSNDRSVCCVLPEDPDPAPSPGCKETSDLSISYLGNGPEVCDAIDVLCPAGKSFNGPCGCGCFGDQPNE